MEAETLLGGAGRCFAVALGGFSLDGGAASSPPPVKELAWTVSGLAELEDSPRDAAAGDGAGGWSDVRRTFQV